MLGVLFECLCQGGRVKNVMQYGGEEGSAWECAEKCAFVFSYFSDFVGGEFVVDENVCAVTCGCGCVL